MAQLARFKLRAGGATAVVALAWLAGTGVAHADTRSFPGVDPCIAPGNGPGTNPGTNSGDGSGANPANGITSAGGGTITPNYGSGTPASADAAYAQLPAGTPALSASASSGTLAFTGSQPLLYGIGGVALVSLGGALVGLSRRRALPEGPENEAS